MLIYTSLSPFPSFDTIGSVSVGSFLSIPAPRCQALKYFFRMCTSRKIMMKVNKYKIHKPSTQKYVVFSADSSVSSVKFYVKQVTTKRKRVKTVVKGSPVFCGNNIKGIGLCTKQHSRPSVQRHTSNQHLGQHLVYKLVITQSSTVGLQNVNFHRHITLSVDQY